MKACPGFFQRGQPRSPAGAEDGGDSPYQATTPAFDTLVRFIPLAKGRIVIPEGGEGECSAGLAPRPRGLSPAGAEVGRGRIPRWGPANSPYQATTPTLHTLVCRPLPA